MGYTTTMIERIIRVRRYENGEPWVEFQEDGSTPHAHLEYNGDVTYEWKDTFKLDKKNLLLRIDKGLKNNEDVSIEQEALFMMDDTITNPLT